MLAGAGLGSAPMGGQDWQLDWGPSDWDESVAAVRAAVAAGAGWIDTAPFYGWGRAEEIIGTALDGMTVRPLVLTKCGDVRGPDGRVVTTTGPGDPLRRAGQPETAALPGHRRGPVA